MIGNSFSDDHRYHEDGRQWSKLVSMMCCRHPGQYFLTGGESQDFLVNNDVSRKQYSKSSQTCSIKLIWGLQHRGHPRRDEAGGCTGRRRESHLSPLHLSKASQCQIISLEKCQELIAVMPISIKYIMWVQSLLGRWVSWLVTRFSSVAVETLREQSGQLDPTEVEKSKMPD